MATILHDSRRWIFDRPERLDALAHRAKSLCDYLRRSHADAGRIAAVRDREVKLYKLARRARRLAKVDHAAGWPAWTDSFRLELGPDADTDTTDHAVPTYPTPEDAQWAAEQNTTWDDVETADDPYADPFVLHNAHLAALAVEMQAERDAEEAYQSGLLFA